MQINRIHLQWAWAVTLVFLILTSVAVAIKIISSPPVIALRYNVIVGVDDVGSRFELLKLPITGALIAGVNLILAKFQKIDLQFLPLLVAMMSAAINLLLFISALFLFKVS